MNLLKNRSKSLLRPLSLVLVLATSPKPVVQALNLTRAPQNQEDGRGLKVQPLKPVEALPTGSKRFALVIGVDEYEDSQINRLEGAGNDAKAIVEALVQYADFPRDQVRLLTSDQPAERKPTRNKILRQLSNLRGAVPKDGLLLIAFAGHGIERGGQAYLLPSDAELSDDVSLLEQSSINVDEMRKRILETGVAQVVMILDACRNDPAAGRGDSDNRTFQTFLYRNGEAKLLKVFRVPERLNVPGDKYHIIIEAQGQEIKHYLQVKSNPNSTRPQPFSLVADATFSNGRIGFGTRDGEGFIVQFVSIVPTK